MAIIDWDGVDHSAYARIGAFVEPGEGYSTDECVSRLLDILSLGPLRGRDARRCFLLAEPFNGRVEVAVPLEFLPAQYGLTQILNYLYLPSEYEYFKQISFTSFQLPEGELKKYVGPQFGSSGVRASLGVRSGPILGAILKTHHSVDSGVYFEGIRAAVRGGVDLLVDDELSCNSSADEFEQRVRGTIEVIREVSSSLDRAVSFIANVNGPPLLAFDLVDICKTSGVTGVMVNPLSCGFGLVSDLASIKCGLPIFSTNIGVAALSRFGSGIGSSYFSEEFVAKAARLSGADAVYCGLSGSQWYRGLPGSGALGALSSSLAKIRSSFRVIAGGLNAGNLAGNCVGFEDNVILLAGSSLFGHRNGPEAGARCLRKVLEIAKRVRQDQEGLAAVRTRILSDARSDIDLRIALEDAHWTGAPERT